MFLGLNAVINIIMMRIRLPPLITILLLKILPLLMIIILLGLRIMLILMAQVSLQITPGHRNPEID